MPIVQSGRAVSVFIGTRAKERIALGEFGVYGQDFGVRMVI